MKVALYKPPNTTNNKDKVINSAPSLETGSYLGFGQAKVRLQWLVFLQLS